MAGKRSATKPVSSPADRQSSLNTMKQLVVNEVLGAMRADAIPAGEAGLWYVWKSTIGAWESLRILNRYGQRIPVGRYTSLGCWTEATLHDHQGECVMNDTEPELRKHLNFVLRAHGRVLVSGLGLGCVIRGLLLNPRVESILLLERDRDVLKLVRPHMPQDPRLEILETDALEWAGKTCERFDCAWHDLWTERSGGEPHLQVVHTQLLCLLRRHCGFQGAWAYPREYARALSRKGVEVLR